MDIANILYFIWGMERYSNDFQDCNKFVINNNNVKMLGVQAQQKLYITSFLIYFGISKVYAIIHKRKIGM